MVFYIFRDRVVVYIIWKKVGKNRFLCYMLCLYVIYNYVMLWLVGVKNNLLMIKSLKNLGYGIGIRFKF